MLERQGRPKKRLEAACAWARGGSIESDREAVERDLQAFGAESAAQAADWLDEEDELAVDVWAENWEAFVTFTRLSTQWRWVGGLAGARRTGLDYMGVTAALRLMGIESTPELFQQLRDFERGALEGWAEE